MQIKQLLPTLHNTSWCKIHEKDGTGKLGGCIINLLCLLVLNALWRLRLKIISTRSPSSGLHCHVGLCWTVCLWKYTFPFCKFFNFFQGLILMGMVHYQTHIITQWFDIHPHGHGSLPTKSLYSKHLVIHKLSPATSRTTWNWNIHTNQTTATLQCIPAPIRLGLNTFAKSSHTR